MASSANGNPSVKSAERTLHILETLAAAPDHLTVSEIQGRLGYPRSSLHALLRTMREANWVEADTAGTGFRIGPQALLTGTAYLDRDPALPHALETLEDLRADIGHTTHYARLEGPYVLYLGSRESRDSVRLVSRVGRRLPAHLTALGQALLAQLTTAEVEALLPAELEKYTPRTITSRDELLVELERVRRRGWASEREQGSLGVACVAAAVDYRIPATDAISCSLPVEAVDDALVERVADSLVSGTQRLAATLRHDGIR